ncbi:hypothetical protein [Kitasatospora sp. NPDC089509]|uniref:hypothetical protein n=1 Tax=Kitasatospora sp. NPDC089509 TaxID=3364079 RepID=UPI00382DE638
MTSKASTMRIAVVGGIVATTVGLAGSAVAATPGPHPDRHAAAVPAAPAVPRASAPAVPEPTAPAVPKASSATAVAHPAITAKPSTHSVRAWHQFRVTGTTSGIAPGSLVTLQQEQHGRFVSLPASMHTGHRGAYDLRVELGIKGPNDLRIISGNTAASPVFTVTVR